MRVNFDINSIVTFHYLSQNPIIHDESSPISNWFLSFCTFINSNIRYLPFVVFIVTGKLINFSLETCLEC